MHAIAIVLMCIGSAVIFGILHDQITARACVEYFTIVHDQMDNPEPISASSEQPTIRSIGRRFDCAENALGLAVYCYALFAALHWASVAQVVNDRSGRVRCANFVTCPFLLLMNKLMPIVLLCLAALIRRRIQTRRRPLFPITSLPLFLGTTLTLVLEMFWLRDSGLDLAHLIWWLTWM